MPPVQFRPPEEVRLTPSQRATAWYFLVVAGLFLLQGLLGGANAHYHVEPGGFYGFDIASWLPYNLSRMWHVQLALFFVSASFLAMGIFIAPMIARREPKHQDKLAIALFARRGGRGRRQPGRRGREPSRTASRATALVLDRHAGLGVPRPGPALADPADGRHGPLGGDL